MCPAAFRLTWPESLPPQFVCPLLSRSAPLHDRPRRRTPLGAAVGCVLRPSPRRLHCSCQGPSRASAAADSCSASSAGTPAWAARWRKAVRTTSLWSNARRGRLGMGNHCAACRGGSKGGVRKWVGLQCGRTKRGLLYSGLLPVRNALGQSIAYAHSKPSTWAPLPPPTPHPTPPHAPAHHPPPSPPALCWARWRRRPQ